MAWLPNFLSSEVVLQVDDVMLSSSSQFQLLHLLQLNHVSRYQVHIYCHMLSFYMVFTRFAKYPDTRRILNLYFPHQPII